MESVAEVFEDSTCREHANRPALQYRGETVSHRELLRVARRCASTHLLQDSLVVVGIDQGKDLVAIELACWLAGVAVCPFDVLHDPRALAVLERLQPDKVVVPRSRFLCVTLVNTDFKRLTPHSV